MLDIMMSSFVSLVVRNILSFRITEFIILGLMLFPNKFVRVPVYIDILINWRSIQRLHWHVKSIDQTETSERLIGAFLRSCSYFWINRHPNIILHETCDKVLINNSISWTKVLPCYEYENKSDEATQSLLTFVC